MIRSLLRYASFLLATELSYGDGAELDEDVGFVTRRSAEKQGQWLARRCQRRQMDSTLSLEQNISPSYYPKFYYDRYGIILEYILWLLYH